MQLVMDSIIAFSIMRPANITGNLLDSERSRRQGKEGKGKKKKQQGKGEKTGEKRKKSFLLDPSFTSI